MPSAPTPGAPPPRRRALLHPPADRSQPCAEAVTTGPWMKIAMDGIQLSNWAEGGRGKGGLYRDGGDPPSKPARRRCDQCAEVAAAPPPGCGALAGGRWLPPGHPRDRPCL